MRTWLVRLDVVFLLFLIAMAILSQWIAPHDPTQIDPINAYLPPSLDHWFGTDELGRDVLSRLIFGARISITVGLVAVGISLLIGVTVGAVSGYFGGLLDSILMRFVDVVNTIPVMFLLLSIIVLLPVSIYTVMIVIGLTGWMGVARLMRAEVLRLRNVEFVQNARLQGVSVPRILLLHVGPNAIQPVIVSATLGVASAILVESALSFLGFGVQPPTPSWGNMLTAGKASIEFAWWMSVFPGLCILFTVLSINTVGESLRRSLDPAHDS